MNNKISAVTADGSVEITFSIFATDNTGNSANNTDQNALPVTVSVQQECNPALKSTLTAGINARVVSSVNAFSNIFTQDIAFRPREGDLLTTIQAYCDSTQGVLWWWVRSKDGRLGWVSESLEERVYLEATNE